MRDYDEQAEAQRRGVVPAPEPARDEALEASVLRRDGSRGALTPTAVLGLQRRVGNAGAASYLTARDEEREDPSPVHETIKTGGSPLDQATRSTMESALGSDFSDVRLHVDRRSAESVQAAAYTVGNDIVVHPSHYSPGTPSAQRTLAHELTHVRQQRSGPVAGSPAPGGVQISDPSDRFEREAEATANSVMSSIEQAPGNGEPEESAAPAARGQAERETEEDEEESES